MSSLKNSNNLKNFMVANLQEKSPRYNWARLKPMLQAQIENSLDLGWKIKDIIILANFNFDYKNVYCQKIELDNFCLTGSKMFGLQHYFNTKIKDISKDIPKDEGETIVWAHDLDCWQNYQFDLPKIKDVGISIYSKPKLNGGSVFWSFKAKDIVKDVVETIVCQKASREEPILNKLLKGKYKNRVTILNETFNIGCSGFIPRIERAEKPIKVSHMNPYNRIAWETHRLDRNKKAYVSISSRLEKILRAYFNLAYTLKK